MGSAEAILLLKILSDIVLILKMGSPATSGMTDEEKKVMLVSEQEKTQKLLEQFLKK